MTGAAKARLRKAAFAARKLSHATLGSSPGTAIGPLLAEIGPADGRTVAAYMAMRTEIDPAPAMAALCSAGARVCVPVIAGKDQPLDFREWHPGCTLVEGPFGALVPETGDWLVPDTLIVPLVAFDDTLNRLGYGGGFYDRTLARLRAVARIRAIGLAYAAQRLPGLPVGPTDQPLDAVVTEHVVIRRHPRTPGSAG